MVLRVPYGGQSYVQEHKEVRCAICGDVCNKGVEITKVNQYDEVRGVFCSFDCSAAYDKAKKEVIDG